MGTNKILFVSGVILLPLASLSFLGMLSSFAIAFLVGGNIIGTGGDYSWMWKFMGMNSLQYVSIALAFLTVTFLTGVPGALLLIWRYERMNSINRTHAITPSR